MSATVKTKQDLMKYFAAVGAAPGHLFSVRDFNSQVMMNTFAPEARDSLEMALRELCTEGVIRKHSATEYLLTAEGLALVHTLRGAREQRPAARAAPGGPSHDWLRKPALQDAVALAVPHARAPGDSSFKVTFFEWRGGTHKRAQRLVDIDAHDRGAAVKLATASLSVDERNRFAVLRVVLNEN
jgi:hypothetical protein